MITIETEEGVFVFNKTRPDGSADWAFGRPTTTGKLKPKKVPVSVLRRFKAHQRDIDAR